MITGIARTAAAVVAAGMLTGLNLAGASGAVAADAAAPSAGLGAGPPTAYVANFLANTVTPINTATNMPGKAIKVGAGPSAIAITPNGKTAYVTNDGTGQIPGHTVTPIDTATNTALKAMKVGLRPVAIAITP
jgi:YVTN family beta-propeller protein